MYDRCMTLENSNSDLQPLTRVTVNLVPKTVNALDRTMDRDQVTKTDGINRAIQLYDFFSEHLTAGSAIYIRRAGSEEMERIHLL